MADWGGVGFEVVDGDIMVTIVKVGGEPGEGRIGETKE